MRLGSSALPYSMNRGMGGALATRVSWLSDENVSNPERLRSTAPIICAIRLSFLARVSKSAADVNDLLGNDGMLKMGSFSPTGDVGLWKVPLFFKEWEALVVDNGWVDSNVVEERVLCRVRRRGLECGKSIPYRLGTRQGGYDGK